MGFLNKLFGGNKDDTPARGASDDNHVKILFRFYSELFEQEMVETMWATIADAKKGLYKLDNIPFYVPLIASGDIVFAEHDLAEGQLTYRKTVEYSGNSTIHIVMMDKKMDKKSIRELFKGYGCASEAANEGYFAMEVPSGVDYQPVKQKLDELEQEGIIGYQESCLSNQHQY